MFHRRVLEFGHGEVRAAAAAVLAVLAGALGGLPAGAAEDAGTEIVLVENGVAKVPLVAGSIAEPVAELRHYLREISGAELEVRAAGSGGVTGEGLWVGLARDFPGLQLEGIEGLGTEGFVIRSHGKGLYLIGREPLGVQHAVTTLLHSLGCRWFFAGKTWEIVPHEKRIAGRWNRREVPSFTVQRQIWPGFGLYSQNRKDWAEWDRHNRMGGPVAIHIGHDFHGLRPERDFGEHPEWFALVSGKRQPSKPCYTHPGVLAKAIEHATKQADAGAKIVSMTPPDGLGYCECPECLAVLQGATPRRESGAIFGTRPDGTVVNVTSETLFGFINRVAAATEEKHPGVRLGCYAYSAYSHPPSFKLHRNVYVQTTTAFRRTPLSLEEQLRQWGERAGSLGIREYYSVYQWDWDGPRPGRVRPERLRKDLRFFREHGVDAVNAEASNNWGPRGLGYYVAAQLMWNVDVDVDAVLDDFFQRAFGPAAAEVRRYYALWYGPDLLMPTQSKFETPPGYQPKRLASEVPLAARDSSAMRESITQPDSKAATGDDDRRGATTEELAAAYRALDEAAGRVRGAAGFDERVDALRLYLHYLILRDRVSSAAKAKDDTRLLEAIRAETVYGARLNDTNMIHTRALIGKAFLRRFQPFRAVLEKTPEVEKEGTGWRRLGAPPSAEELKDLWAKDGEWLKVRPGAGT